MYLKYILHLKCWRSHMSYSSKFFFIKINLYFQWNKRKCHWNPLWKYRNTYMYQCFLKYPNILRYENLTQYRSILFYTWLCVLAIHLLLKYYNGIHKNQIGDFLLCVLAIYLLLKYHNGILKNQICDFFLLNHIYWCIAIYHWLHVLLK